MITFVAFLIGLVAFIGWYTRLHEKYRLAQEERQAESTSQRQPELTASRRSAGAGMPDRTVNLIRPA